MSDEGHDRILVTTFLRAMVHERYRAHEKHGKTSMEQAPLLGHKRASVLVEEAVECMRALNDHEHGDITLVGLVAFDGRRTPNTLMDDLDKELIQTAAMAYTWWASRRGDQLPPAPEPEPDAVVKRGTVLEMQGGERIQVLSITHQSDMGRAPTVRIDAVRLS